MPLLNNRLQKLAPGGYQVPSPTGGPDVPDISNRLSSLSGSQDATGSEYNTPILDQYKKTLANPPVPENYAPSKTRQVLGALAGMGAGASAEGMTHGGPVGFRYDPKAQIGAQQAITDEPLNKAMARYSNQAAILGKGAQVEEQDIAQKRGIEKLQADIANKEQTHQLNQNKLELAYKKESDIKDQKINELTAKAEKADADRNEKAREADAKREDIAKQLEFHKAEAAAKDAIHRLDLARKDKTLDDLNHQRDVVNAQHEHDSAVKDAHIKALEDQAKENARIREEANKNKGANTGSVTTTSKPPRKLFGFEIPGTGGEEKTVVKEPLQKHADPLGIR